MDATLSRLRPRLADLVTAARIAFAPPCAIALLFLEGGARIPVVVALFFLGWSDFLDGYLARRFGGTAMGPVLDHIADKVFVASLLLAMVAGGWLPVWVAATVLLRETFIAGLRVVAHTQDLSLPVSDFGRIKAGYQMNGIGVLLLLSLAPAGVVWVVLAAMTLPWVVLSLPGVVPTRSRVSRWMVLGLFVPLAVTLALWPTAAPTLVVAMVLGSTWGSALSYLIAFARQWERRLGTADLIRIGVAAAVSVVAPLAVAYSPVALIPMMISLTLLFIASGWEALQLEASP